MTLKRAVMVGALLCVPVLAVAQKTSYDFDKTADFTQFKTYVLKDGTKIGNPLIDDGLSPR
jgi:hypothetical protein